jgi:hypothetical protein
MDLKNVANRIARSGHTAGILDDAYASIYRVLSGKPSDSQIKSTLKDFATSLDEALGDLCNKVFKTYADLDRAGHGIMVTYKDIKSGYQPHDRIKDYTSYLAKSFREFREASEALTRAVSEVQKSPVLAEMKDKASHDNRFKTIVKAVESIKFPSIDDSEAYGVRPSQSLPNDLSIGKIYDNIEVAYSWYTNCLQPGKSIPNQANDMVKKIQSTIESLPRVIDSVKFVPGRNQ